MRLAKLCFFTLLSAVSAPALAANDNPALLGLQESQAPARGQYGGGLIEMLLTGASQEPQSTAASIAKQIPFG